MSDGWDDFTNTKLREKAAGNLAGAQGVDPAVATSALQNAPATGVPAEIGMHAPDEVKGMALFPDHTAILNASPEVSSFTASDPAKAAAVSDDLHNFAGVAIHTNNWAAIAAMDFLNPGVSAARQLFTDIKRDYDMTGKDKPTMLGLIPGFSPQDKRLGSILGDVAGVAFTLPSGVVNVAARPFSYIPGADKETTFKNGNAVTKTLSQQQTQQKIAGMFGTALMGVMPERPSFKAPPIDLGNATVVGEQPRLPGPTEPVQDARFTDIKPPGVRPEDNDSYHAIAELDAENINRLQTSLTETKTLGRAPELAQDFLQNHTPVGDATVSVPAESITKLWDAGHDVFTDHADAINSALVSGSEVRIPLAQYLTETAGKPFQEELNNATRFRDNGVSLDQVKDLPKAPEGFDIANNESAFVAKPNTVDTNVIEGMLPLAEQFGGKFAVGRANTAFQFPTEGARQSFMEAASKQNLAPDFEQSTGPAVERRSRPRTAEDQAAFEASIHPVEEGMQTRGNFELTSADTPSGRAYVLKPNTTNMSEIEALLPKVQQYGGRYAMGRANTAFQFRTPEAREAFLNDQQVPRTEPTIPEDVEPELHQPIRELAARVDDVVEQVFKENALDTLFTEPKAMGLNKGLFERYGEAVEAARSEIHDRLMQRTYNQIKRERSPDFKAAVALHKEQAIKDINAQPNVQAMRAFASADMKIDRDAIPSELRLPNNILKKGGLSPDEAAELAGYPTGKDLLLDLHNLQVAIEANGGSLSKYVSARAQVYAEEQARQMTGYDISPEALLEAAREAVASPKIEDLLIDALQEVGQRLGLPLDKEAVVTVAENHFNALNTKDAAKPKTFSQDMKRLGDKAETAILAGKDIQAFKFKQQQLLQFHQLKMAFAFQKELARADKTLRQLAKKPINAGMDQTARNHLRWIAREVGYKVNTNKYEGVDEALKGVSLEQYVNGLRSRGFEPVFATIPRLAVPDMTVEQFRGVADTVKSLAQLGRWEKKAFKEGQAEELANIAQQVKENANAIGRPFTAGEMHQLKGKIAGLPGRAGRSLGSAVARPETFLYWLDRETNGPLMQYIVSELQNGKYFKTDKIKEIGDSFRDFVETQPKGWQHSLEDAVEVPELLYSRGADGQPIQWLTKRGDVVMMATHFGTQSNFQKLVEGFGWDPQTVRDVADRVLTEADWKYVQHILDINKALLPEVKDLYRATVGLAMKELPATPIPTPFGTLPGGYRHISYDWNSIEEVEGEDGELHSQEDPTALHASDLFGPEYRTATPPNSYTLARTQFSAPMNLEHSILHREIESVIHDLAFRKALIQATKIMRLPQVRQAVREALGPEYSETINGWMKDIARGSSYDQTVLKGGAALIRGVRRRFTIVQIGYNVATLLKHGGIAASHISGEVGIPEFAKASADLMKDKELQKWVDENSGEVRGSLMNLDRDVRELMQDLFRKQGFIENWRYHAFTMFGAVKRVEAMATWLAKYRTLTDGGTSHEDAVALANKSVRDTQGAGSPVDLPALWRGDASFWSEVGKLSNIFTGFENTATNRAWTIIRRSSGGGGGGKPPNTGGVSGWQDRGPAGGRRDFSKSFSDLLSYFVIPALYATAFDTVTQGKLHKGAKNGAVFLEHYAENTLKGMLGGSVPFGNMLAELPRAIQTRGKDWGSDSPLKEMMGATVGTAVNAWDATHKKTQHKVEDRWVQHAFETAGYIFELPVKPLSKGGQFLWDKAQGHVKDKSMLEFMRGVVFGPSSEEAKKPR